MFTDCIGCRHIDWATYNQRPKRSLMQILEDDRRIFGHSMSAEQLEALTQQRIVDFDQYGDDPLMWDRARQFRDIETAKAEAAAKKLAAGLDPNTEDPVDPSSQYSTKV